MRLLGSPDVPVPEFHQNRSQQGHRAGREQHEQRVGRGIRDAAGAAARDRVDSEAEGTGGGDEEEKEKEKKIQETQTQVLGQRFVVGGQGRKTKKETQEAQEREEIKRLICNYRYWIGNVERILQCKYRRQHIVKFLLF